VASAFLHISHKLLSSLLAEQHGVYYHSLPGLCVRTCGNRGAVVVVVQTPIEHAVPHLDAIPYRNALSYQDAEDAISYYNALQYHNTLPYQ